MSIRKYLHKKKSKKNKKNNKHKLCGGVLQLKNRDDTDDKLFECPISFVDFTDPSTPSDPVIALDGYTYDRQAITAHLDRYPHPKVPISPMTNEEMGRILVPNRNLNDIIDHMRIFDTEDQGTNQEIIRDVGKIKKETDLTTDKEVGEITNTFDRNKTTRMGLVEDETKEYDEIVTDPTRIDIASPISDLTDASFSSRSTINKNKAKKKTRKNKKAAKAKKASDEMEFIQAAIEENRVFKHPEPYLEEINCDTIISRKCNIFEVGSKYSDISNLKKHKECISILSKMKPLKKDRIIQITTQVMKDANIDMNDEYGIQSETPIQQVINTRAYVYGQYMNQGDNDEGGKIFVVDQSKPLAVPLCRRLIVTN